MKIFTKTNKYLTTETMQKNQNIMIIQITQQLVK